MPLPRENETHPTLHPDEAADVVTILQDEASRVAEALSAAWGADDFPHVERLGHWLIRVQLLLTAFGRSDIAKQYSTSGAYKSVRLVKPPGTGEGDK